MTGQVKFEGTGIDTIISTVSAFAMVRCGVG